jgi:H+-transporting ATPase
MLSVAVDSPHTLEQLWQVAEHLPQTHPPTLAVAALVVTLILVAQALAPRLPMALVLVVGTIWASHAYNFAGLGIATLGAVPGGLPSLALPSVSWHEILALIPIAPSCFVIIIAQSAVTAGGFALRHHERVEEDADILGLSAANAAAALSGAEAAKRLDQYGPNAIVEKEQGLLSTLIGYFMGPIAYMIEAAAIVSALLGRWDDFTVIFGLLIFNAALEFWQDRKASSALAALKGSLAPEASVLRDGKWAMVKAADLVPGDIVAIRLGVIVPADLRLTKGDRASIDQAALTGESLPVAKKVGDEAYSGSLVKQGEMEGVVIATGGNTFCGRTAKLVAGAGSVSHAQRAMFQIGNFLIVVALAMIMVGFDVWRDIVIADTWKWSDALNILHFVLILLVASIPVAMPAVFSITMALGALALSKQQAIVSKLSAIEEMAGVDILCSDKTGTLTKNQLKLGAPILFDSKDSEEVILAAALASKIEDRDAIDTAVIEALQEPGTLKSYTRIKFVPFDPVTKRTAATVKNAQGKTLVVAKGAPQAIVELANPAAEVADQVKQTVDALAARGYRALGVARSEDEGASWSLLGILPMFDPPRDDSKETIELANAKGVRVKMITGDDTAIARETARQLGMGANIVAAADAFPKNMDPNRVPAQIANSIERADGFARVFPEHKYAIVKTLQERGHLVAMTGDGVNDAPALKQADCGTAVSGATDAARSTAALILTASGLSVINDAIDEARRIFGGITSYTVYRVALTVDIMFLVVLLTILLGFKPLTAIMIVVLAILDDAPIMAIAYDNTEVAPKPIRWRMPRVLGVSSVSACSRWFSPLGCCSSASRSWAGPSTSSSSSSSAPSSCSR